MIQPIIKTFKLIFAVFQDLIINLSGLLFRLTGGDNNVIIFEGDNVDNELENVYQLRRKVFVKELGWVSEEKEKDIYDTHAIHFVAHKKGSVAGYVRLISSGNSFMLENEFKDLLTKSDLVTLHARKDEAAEISRLVLEKKLRNRYLSFWLRILLYRTIYQWSLKHEIRYWYMVVSSRFLKHLQKLFPCRSIGISKEYNKGHGVTVAAVLDLREAEKKIQREHPNLYRWFRNKTARSK